MFTSVFVLIICIVAPLAFAAFIIGVVLYFKHRREAMWHETARLALEKGQPLPAAQNVGPRGQPASRDPRDDIRAGLILIAVGIGIAMFFRTVGARDVMGIGAIPGFIGVALLLFGLFSRKKSPTGDIPPQS